MLTKYAHRLTISTYGLELISSCNNWFDLKIFYFQLAPPFSAGTVFVCQNHTRRSPHWKKENIYNSRRPITYSNEAERANYIYNFKFKKSCGLHFLYKNILWMYLIYPKNPTWLRAIPIPRSEKCPWLVNACATSELSMRAWSWNVTDSKKTIFDLITPRYFPIWQSKEMSHYFVRGQSVAETCFSHRSYSIACYRKLIIRVRLH